MKIIGGSYGEHGRLTVQHDAGVQIYGTVTRHWLKEQMVALETGGQAPSQAARWRRALMCVLMTLAGGLLLGAGGAFGGLGLALLGLYWSPQLRRVRIEFADGSRLEAQGAGWEIAELQRLFRPPGRPQP